MAITRRTFVAATATVGATLLTGCQTQETPTAEAEADETAVTDTAQAADLVLRNGNLITCLSETDRAQALAVKDGELVYVGDDEGVDAYVGDGTEVVDLDGKTVTPGFIDGHIHAPGLHLSQFGSVNLMAEDATVEAYSAAIQAFMDEHPDYPIIVADSMDLKAFPESNPTNDWLNDLSLDVPIQANDVSTHGCVLNDCAIQLCGITKDTPNPASGIIYKDESGELTGYFSDCADLLGALPTIEYTEDQYKEAILGFAAEANSYGITTIDSGGDEMPRALLNEMSESGELTFRINTDFFCGSTLDEQEIESVLARIEEERQYENDFINVRQVKFKVDGVPEGKSSYLLEPYDEAAGTDPDYVSSAAATTEELGAFMAAVNGAGYTVQTHCMGDASMRLSNDAAQMSVETNGLEAVRACRNKIAHCNLMEESEYERLANFNTIAAMQPLWFYYDPMFSPLEEQMFGTERFEREYHIKDMIDAGVTITGSNDYPVTFDFAPLHAMEAGVKQCSPYEGEEDDPETYTRNADQGVSMWEMLKMYTVNAAYGAFFDDRVGTLEVGKKADLVVLDRDILTCDYKEVSDTVVERTIIDGRTVYSV